MLQQLCSLFLGLIVVLFVVWGFWILLAGLMPLMPPLVIILILAVAIQAGWRMLR